MSDIVGCHGDHDDGVEGRQDELTAFEIPANKRRDTSMDGPDTCRLTQPWPPPARQSCSLIAIGQPGLGTRQTSRLSRHVSKNYYLLCDLYENVPSLA